MPGADRIQRVGQPATHDAVADGRPVAPHEPPARVALALRGWLRSIEAPPDRRAAGTRCSAGGRLGRRHAPPTGRTVSPRRRAAPVGAVSPGALEAFECRPNERPDRLEHVPALLHDDRRELRRAEAASRLPIPVRAHVERRVRIVRRRHRRRARRRVPRFACSARPRTSGDTARATRRRPSPGASGTFRFALRRRRRTRGSAGTIRLQDRRAPTR